MVSRDFILWEVDAQKDFMLPGGKLYVPNAEKLLPNIRRLTNEARQGHAFLVSHGCVHTPDDPEFKQFPPHCMAGTDGAKLVPEALADTYVTIPNDAESSLPNDFAQYQQVVIEKPTLDIFESRHANNLVNRLAPDAEFVVFGVVTEYCVRFAAKGLLERGRRVAIVKDAIETLNPAEGQRAISELLSLGAEVISTDEALARLHQSAAARKT
ncbi:MAG: cysteine hydrolase family protein [Candidatus Acidiferrales bacterium]